MSIELPEKDFPEEHITVDNEAKFLKLTNDLQIILIQQMLRDRSIGENDIDAKRKVEAEWTDKYSKKFREIFHREIIANPHLAEDLHTIPDAEIEKIKGFLFEDSSKVDPENYPEDLAA